MGGNPTLTSSNFLGHCLVLPGRRLRDRCSARLFRGAPVRHFGGNGLALGSPRVLGYSRAAMCRRAVRAELVVDRLGIAMYETRYDRAREDLDRASSHIVTASSPRPCVALATGMPTEGVSGEVSSARRQQRFRGTFSSVQLNVFGGSKSFWPGAEPARISGRTRRAHGRMLSNKRSLGKHRFVSTAGLSSGCGAGR